ncbi:KRAB-A domain-containing protein 2 [Trichinella spiralis]|uniref:KRAB-A domain-containing protein 2 n=1 Tax=Trichinella spiralis TaxID=6334 RepID=UPI0001EFEED4|nr:KRAB-A domain-containing protein 2 [Trichinella spiralis]
MLMDRKAVVHETTGQNPFKVTFGEEPRIGLESYVLPKSLVDAAKTEEEVEGFLAFHEANKKESLNRDEKTIAEKTFLHRDQAFVKAQEEAAAGSLEQQQK